MVQFIYEKYDASVSYGLGDGEYVGTFTAPSLSGYNSYYVTSTGEIVLAGTFVTAGAGQTVYATSGGTLIARTWQGNSQFVQYNYRVVANYAKGSLLGSVTAEDGTYPNDGMFEGNWYIKKYIADKPLLISPNGGEVLSGISTVNWSPGETGLIYSLEYSANGGQGWSVLTLDAGTGSSYAYNFSSLPPSNVAKIRVRGKRIFNGTTYYTEYDESDGVFTTRDNIAPLKPTLRAPLGSRLNWDVNNRFAWTHNDSGEQLKAELRLRVVGSTVWSQAETFTIYGSVQETFIYYDPGVSYGMTVPIEWQVRTFDQEGLASPWSDLGVYEVATPTDKPVMLTPTTIVNGVRPVVQWSSLDQVAYQLRIKNIEGVVLWDTGEVASTIKARTVGIDFINGASYIIELRVKNSAGVFSFYEQKSVVTSYTPPAVPIVIPFVTKAGITLSIVNPAPVEPQPEILGNEVFKKVNDTWIRIGYGILSIFTDYSVVSEEVVEYYVRTTGVNNTSINSDIITVKGPRLTGVWLHDVRDPEATIHQFKIDSNRSEDRSKEHAYQQFAGRKRAAIQYGVYEEHSVSVDLDLLKRKSDRERLIQFYESGGTLLYRDGRGRKVYSSLPILPMNDVFYGNRASLIFSEIDYNEEV